MHRYHYNENYIITDNSQFKGELFFVPLLWDWIVDGHGVDEKGHPPGDCFMIDADLLDDMVQGKSTQIAQAVRSLLQPYLGGVATVKEDGQGLVSCTLVGKFTPGIATTHTPTHLIITWDENADIIHLGLPALLAFFKNMDWLDTKPGSEDLKELTEAWENNEQNIEYFTPWQACGYNFIATSLPHGPGMDAMTQAKIGDVSEQGNHLASVVAGYQPNPLLLPLQELLHWTQVAADMKMNTMPTAIFPVLDQARKAIAKTSLPVPDPELTDEEYEDHANSGVD